MKQKLTLLILALFTTMGAWAKVLNLTPSNGTYPESSGNYVNSISFSTTPAVTIAVNGGANNMDKRLKDTYLQWHSGTSGSSTYTISVEGDYVITAYSITGEANTSAQTLTAGSVSHEFAVGTSSSFDVTGLNSSSVSFVQTGANASGLKITSISVTVVEGAPVTYVISDANGVVFTSDPIIAGVGTTITTLPASLQRAFCSYSAINHTVVEGENTINVTVSYDLPFETGTDKLYYAKLRGHYVYYDATNNDVRTNQSSNEHTDAYKWSFSGNPYDGIKVKNAKTGTYLDNTSSTVQLTESGYAWTIHRLNDSSTFGLYNGTNHINEQNHSNHNLIYWWAFETDAGSQWNVEEVPASEVDVTYKVVLAGNVVATATEKQAVGGAPAVPASLNFAFTSYTYDIDVIPGSATTVTATPTFNMPFETSTDYATATWYYLQGHATYSDRYVSTNGTAVVWSIGKGITEAYQWAFIGNPIEGIKIINKAAGATYFLQETDPLTMATTDKSWTIKQQTNTGWQSGANGFGLWSEVNNKYVNTQSSTLKYWGSFDQGSTFWVEAVPDNYASNVEAEVKPWFDNYGSYFQLKTSVVEANQTKYEAALDNCDLATYQQLLGLLDEPDNYVYPSTGFYRIKSIGARAVGESYIAYGKSNGSSYYGLITKAATAANQDATTIFYLNRQSNGKYAMAIQGLNVQAASQSTIVSATTDAAQEYTFIPSSPGYAVMTVNGGQYEFLHESGWTDQGYDFNVVLGWGASAGASQWTVEPVETLTVPLNGPVDGSYYATFCVPFDVTLDGATAYTLDLNATETALTMTEVEGTVAAGTPVLLKGTSASATASISTPSSTAISTETALTGTYVAKAVAGGTDYFLGMANGKVGFYHWDGSTLSANRAYLEASKLNNSGVKGFALDFEDDATGINNVNANLNLDEAIYNLAGQRLSKMQKGINIINGKKILK